MWEVEADPVQPQAAIDWFRNRLPLTDATFRGLEESARRRAFTVGGVASLDLVQDTLNSLTKALEDGATFSDWKAQIGARLEAAWGKPNPHRLVTVFDTNVQKAYGAGRWRSAVESERPYWSLATVLDGRTSTICLALTGTVLPADDPFWRSHIPPLHWRCRTALVTLSDRQAQAQGVTSKAPTINALEGFGATPEMDDWSPDPTRYDPALWAAYTRDRVRTELERAARTARAYDLDAVPDPREFGGANRAGIAAFVPARGRIELNPDHEYWLNPGRILDSGDLSTTSSDHVVRHEVAHARIWAFDRESYAALARMTWADVPLEDAARVARGVSFVAGDTPGEFVSETFAGLEFGLRYSDDVMTLYALLHGGAL